MKLSIKTTFNFGKLASELPKIIEKNSQRYARSSAKGAKENISKGLTPPLSGFTRHIRKLRKRTGTKPLYETGALHRSIKGTSEGLKMLKYGIYHHHGFTTGAKSMFPDMEVPARPFIFPDKKTILTAFNSFRKDFRKALRK